MYRVLPAGHKFVILITLLAALSNSAKAQTETLSSGAFIINMGVVPQTAANALKPYGLIYDLMRNNNVPIKWVVSQTKVKDGVDFTYSGVQYKGGTFIIPAEFRTTAVNAKIAAAAPVSGLGVIGVTTTSALTVDVTQTLTSIPKWTLDDKNGAKAEAYLIAAGITNTAFPGAYNWKAPALLDCCDDFFVMPHADPVWLTHSRLLTWNLDCKGSIWAACHATSALENMVDPANRATQTNFLTQKVAGLPGSGNYAASNSLILWGSHSGGSVPYIHQYPNDLVAQYMGPTDAAHQNGSEQIDVPNQSATGGWNPGAKIIAYDPTQANVTNPIRPDKTNAAAVIVYGRGFDDPLRGFVMYEPAHSHAGTAPNNIAAQRVFLNFSFFQVQPKAPQIGAVTGISSGQQIVGGSTLTGINVVATSPLPGTTFTYLWSSSCGGTFSNATGATTNFTAPSVGAVTPCVITCKVTDNCGRVSFKSIPVTILPPPAPPAVANDVANLAGSCGPGTSVTLNVLTNDVPNVSPITFTSLNQGAASPANAGTWTSDGMGNVTFVPAANFNGAATITYTVTNALGLTNTATITVNVGSTDANGCTSNQVYAPSDIGLITLATGSFVSQSGTTASVDELSLDDAENIYSDKDADFVDFTNGFVDNLILSIGSTLPLRAKDTINLTWTKKTAAQTGTISIQIGTSAAGPWTNAQTFTNSTNATPILAAVTSSYLLPSGAASITHIRISAGNITTSTNSVSDVYVDAVEYKYLTCLTRAPQLTNDVTTVLEDAPAIINVLANDNDAQGLPLTVSRIVTQPSNGKVSINLDGTVTYITTTDNATATSFIYEACNSQGYCATATVDITVAADGCAAGSYRATPPAGAQTRFFQFGFAGANAATANPTTANFRDSKLSQDKQTTNYGATNKIDVGFQFSGTKAIRPVFQFNISEIPTNAVVQNATFSVYRAGGNNNLQAVNLHGLSAAFVESEVTWLIRSTGNNWGTAGGSFGSLVSSANLNGVKTRFNWDVKDLVTTWVATPANNFGLLLKTDETLNKSHQFNTKEIGTVGFRPGLSVTYVVPEPCAAITNRAPLAQPDYATTVNGQAVVISPLPNDADVDAGNTFTITAVSGITAGSATFTGTTITYTANINATVPRTERLTYTITDNNGATDQAYVYITVTNAPPTANKDLASTNSGTLVSIPVVTSNDNDPEGGSLSAPTITTGPKNGTATVVGNNIEYTPGPGFTGKDTLVYQLCEAAAGSCSPVVFCDTALVVITVNNQPPVAVNDLKTMLPCISTTFSLIGNDTDPDAGILAINSISALSIPAAGTLTNNNDGTVTFLPTVGFLGVVTFTYTIIDNGITPQISAPATVTMTVSSPVNTAPDAVNDVESIFMDETSYYSVRDNDTDPEGDQLRIPTITIAPIHGTAIVLGNGLVQYTPNPGYFGTDVLTYQLCDSSRIPATCATAPPLCDVATVTYTIEVPNTVNAINDENSTWINTPVSGGVMANDYDLEGNAKIFTGFIDGAGNPFTSGSITVSGVDATGAPVANAGTLTINADGTYTFTPANNFTGVVTVPYTIADDNANAATDRALLRITVTPLPSTANSIIANNDENISYGAPVAGNVVSNDRDPQGNPFTVTGFNYDTNGDGTPDGTGVVGTPVAIGGQTTSGLPVSNAGTLTLNANGSYTFVPAPDFHGSVDVPYTICDNVVPPACQTAILHIDVLPDLNGPLNDPPVAGDDFNYTNVNTPVNGSFVANDSDPNTNPVSLNGTTIAPAGPATPIGAPVATAQGGTIQYFANGTYLYTPPAGYVGPDSVAYTICDVTAVNPQPLCTQAFIHLLVGVDNSTDAVNDENSTWQDVNVSGGVLANDFDAENNTQTFGSFLTQGAVPGAPITSGATVSGVDKLGAPVASAGTITFAADGSYTFDPSPTFTGTVTIPYRLCDNGNLSKCDTAYLTITVDPYPSTTNSVIANNDENVSYGAPVSGGLLVNDRDPQGNAFTVTSFVGGTVGTGATVAGVDQNGNPVANAGTLLINADGTYTFTPTAGFVGSINVPYTITDALGATSTAVLHIDVLKDPNGPANDPPVPGDDFAYTNVNTPVTSSFVNNDSDPNANPISVNGTTINTGGPHTPIGAPVATAQGGTVQFYADGTYTYTPPAGYVGPDNVPYTICDVTAIAPQPLCNTAFIHLLVGVDNSTDAVNDENSTWQDVNVSGGVLANDFDAENNTQTFGSFLTQGATPGAPIASGATIAGVDKLGAPVASAGTITFAADGSYTFDPSPTFTGTVTVPYRLCDNGNLSKCDTAYLTITVDPLPTSGINTVIANNDENISYGGPVSNTLFANDRDPQGDAFTVTAVTGGTPGAPFTVAGIDANGNPVANAGTLVVNANGTYTFTPTAGFVGSINVPYTITDALGATSTAVLHIDVVRDPNGPLNDPPFAGDDFGYTTVNKPVSGNFIGNDTDPNSNPLSYMGTTIVPAGPATPIGAPVATAQGGTVQFYANGTYLYTPPVGYVGPDNVNYTVCDVTAIAPQPLCTDAQIHLLIGPGVSIAGKVWDDADGNVIDAGAGEPETNIGGTLYVNLVDALGNVVATTAVLPDGSYSFTNITPGVSYTIQLSTNQGVVGNPAPAVALPAGWVNTGETRNGIIDGGTLGVIDTRNYGFTNTINFDFGIEQLPNTDPHTTNIPQPTVNQFITLNGGANPPILSGIDPEDCSGGCTLASKSVIIDVLPANSELYYNGILVTAGQQINNFDPSLLQVKITSATLGAVSTSFQYSFVDAAGKKDPTPATYTLTWLTPLPVTGLYVTARLNNEAAIIDWKTETEINSDYFVVERSTDNVNFTQVGTVAAAGNSTAPRNYSFTDDITALMQNDVVYYRIRQIDIDARYKYSNVAIVKMTKTVGIQAWPNPFTESISININSTAASQINIKLINVPGQVLRNQSQSISRGTTQVTMRNLNNLASGIYFLQIEDGKGGISEVIKFVKE